MVNKINTHTYLESFGQLAEMRKRVRASEKWVQLDVKWLCVRCIDHWLLEMLVLLGVDTSSKVLFLNENRKRLCFR